MLALAILLVLLALVAFYAIAIYNKLVKLKNLVAEAWSGIDVQLKKRYDLIPNLVETVKGYASHERGTLDEVTEARAAVVNAGTPAGKMEPLAKPLSKNGVSVPEQLSVAVGVG